VCGDFNCVCVECVVFWVCLCLMGCCDFLVRCVSLVVSVWLFGVLRVIWMLMLCVLVCLSWSGCCVWVVLSSFWRLIVWFGWVLRLYGCCWLRVSGFFWIGCLSCCGELWIFSRVC